MPHPLRLWRHKHDLTLVALADQANVSIATLSRFERGSLRISSELLNRLEQITGISAEELLAEPRETTGEAEDTRLNRMLLRSVLEDAERIQRNVKLLMDGRLA